MLGNAQFLHTFTVHRNLQKELFIGLYIQQLHHLGFDWTKGGHILLHQGAYVLTQWTLSQMSFLYNLLVI